MSDNVKVIKDIVSVPGKILSVKILPNPCYQRSIEIIK